MKRKEVVIFILVVSIIIELTLIHSISISGNFYEYNDDPLRSTEKPMVNANIKLYSKNNNTYESNTDENGHFLLNITSSIEEDNPDYYIKYYEVYLNNNLITTMVFNHNFSSQKNVKLAAFINLDNVQSNKSENNLYSTDYVLGKNYPDFQVFTAGEINTSKRPLLLVPGWSNNADSSTNQPWYNYENGYGFDEELMNKGYEAYKLQYWPANLSNRKNAGLIGYVTGYILWVIYNNTDYDKLDVVSHSMGGLAVMGYIQEMGINSKSEKRPYYNNIRKFVIIAGPMYGSYFANIIDKIDSKDILNKHNQCKNLINEYGLNGGSEATLDMEIGSDFTWELNKKPINKGVEYLTILGSKVGDRTNLHKKNSENSYCLSNRGEINDGVVSIINGNLVNRDVPLIIFDLFHTNKCNYIQKLCIPIVGCSYNKWFCTDGIEADTKTFNIVHLFLNDNLTYTTAKNYLNTNLGEIYYNPLEVSDSLPSELKNKGSIIIDLKNSEILINNNSLFLSVIDDFNFGVFKLEQNKNTKRWFYSYVTHVPDKLINFTTMLPIGEYDLLINGNYYSKEIEILPGQVNLLEINLDEDSDNYDLDIVGGSDCNDSNPIEFPNQIWYMDIDNDGFSEGTINESCERPESYKVKSELISNKSDCNDNNNSINPNAEEVCNYVDDNCNSKPDDDIICKNFFYNMKLGDEFTANFENGSYTLKFSSLNTVRNDCTLRIMNDTDMEFVTFFSKGINQSQEFPLLFNDTFCNIYDRFLKLKVSVLNTPSLSIISPQNNSIIDSSNILIKFNTSNWDIGGKGDTHIHFHIEGNPKLSFSDHLMFYNGNNNIVELNLQNGKTPFATWINENTIRLNNLSNGKYKVRAHLATESHQPPGNKEADIIISFIVNVSKEDGLCTINAPLNNLISKERRINFDIIASKKLARIEYLDQDERNPRWRMLCRNCNEHNKSKSFSDGEHNIFIRCYDFIGNKEEHEKNIIIDSKSPQISKTDPSRGFASGIFNVEFTEENPSSLILFYGNRIKNKSLNIENDCSLDRTRYKCERQVNLSDFDGQEIRYWFELNDIVGNKGVSRETPLKVDTTKPIIDSFTYAIDKRKVEFSFEITEQNFDEITYIDPTDNRPHERRLCKILKDNTCQQRKTFRLGEHSVIIYVRDRAGKVAEEEIAFKIV